MNQTDTQDLHDRRILGIMLRLEQPTRRRSPSQLHAITTIRHNVVADDFSGFDK